MKMRFLVMPSRVAKGLLLLFALTVLIYVGFIVYSPRHSQLFIDSLPKADVIKAIIPTSGISVAKLFLVNTPHCKIPDVPAFDESIQNLIRPPIKISCGENRDVTYQDGNTLFVNWAVVRDHYKQVLKQCCYNEIVRAIGSDQSIKYSETVKCFSHKEMIPYEFIKVKCFNEDNKEFYRNFHAFVLKVPPKRSSNSLPKEKKLNVLVVGIDAVSRLNFIRQMPRTRSFLLNELSAVELKGYNKVADNTFVNIVPMFTGKYLEELPWDETKSMLPFDKYPIVWKNFSSHGYTTLFAEDFPSIAIFNYLKFGFLRSPTEHYLRPFTLAMEAETNVWHHDDECFGSRLETDIVLNYTHDFAKTYTNRPYFGFTFITRLTHNDINRVGAADRPHFDFLSKMKEDGLLDNTVLVYMSDHGARFGPIVKTYVGKLEERLPLMYVAFPKWFSAKYPRALKNLETNSHRLTTPFDIHETFLHLLQFNGDLTTGDLSQRGISLLNEIPVERSCESASILPHWCVCQNRKQIDPNSEEALRAGRAVVSQINHEISSYTSICAEFSVDKVTEVMKMQADEKLLTFKQSLNDVIDRKVFYGDRAHGAIVNYLVTVIVRPGGGIFEATVKFDEDNRQYSVLGDMSRINKYGDTSQCVNVHRLKKFCLCKSLKN